MQFGEPETWGMKVGEFLEKKETLLPQQKPQELLDLQEQNRKSRILDALNKIGGGMESSSRQLIERENFADGADGRVRVPATEENLKKLDNLIKNTNLKVEEIAVKMGFTPGGFRLSPGTKNTLVKKYLEEYGPIPEGRFKITKLTGDEAKIKKAIELKESGLSTVQVADELNTDRTSIHNYFRKGGREDLVGPINVKQEGEDTPRQKATKVRKEKIKFGEKFASKLDKEFNKKEKKRVEKINEFVSKNIDDLSKNKKLVNLINLKLDKKGNILSKEKSPEEIKKSLKTKRFFERDHISSVAKKKRNMQFPVNFQMSPYNINQGFFTAVETYAKRPDADPAKLEKISKVLDEYGLRLDTGKGIIGAKQIPASQVVDRNLSALDLPTDLGKPFKPGIQPDGQLKDLPGGNEKGFLGGEKLAKAAGQKVLQALKVLGQPSIAAGFAADELSEGNIKTAGASLLAPELVGSFAPAGKGILSTVGRFAANPFGKAVRAFTPLGLLTIGAGMGKDVYDEYKRREALTDEERLAEDIERDRAADEMMIGAAEGGRIGFADGPDDPSKRKFMKFMGIMSLLPFGIGKAFKMAEKAAPVVQQLKNTSTSMPEWFPDFVNKMMFTTGGKKIDADVMEYTTPELPGVKMFRSDDGQIVVEGRNAYDEPYEIVYRPPGYELVDEKTGKAVKTQGEFIASDTQFRRTGPEMDDYDVDGVVVDDIDNILGGNATELEGFATGTGKSKYTRGQKEIDMADAQNTRADVDEGPDIDMSDYED